jgi:hypothetical protein
MLQPPDFSKEFVLVTDTSDVAISAVPHQRVQGDLAPISYYSRLLSPMERCSTYERECLAILFGCEKCRIYLEHKEFYLHCDNLVLCWLLKRVKDVGRLGRWILRLVPFKFRVSHTRGVDNVVADALSRMFEGISEETPVARCASLMESLPLVYSSLEEHQKVDPWSKKVLEDVPINGGQDSKFQISRNLLFYWPKGAKRRRWVVPTSLRSMLLHYFHDTPLSGHLGARKTFTRIAANLWWLQIRNEIFNMCAAVTCVRGRSLPRTLRWVYTPVHRAREPWNGCL